jgi:hypothetical protein
LEDPLRGYRRPEELVEADCLNTRGIAGEAAKIAFTTRKVEAPTVLAE